MCVCTGLLYLSLHLSTPLPSLSLSLCSLTLVTAAHAPVAGTRAQRGEVPKGGSEL